MSQVSKRRVVFLSVSAAALVGVVLLAHAVLLPFLLAIVIAYVLTPAVAWLERRRVPRAAAILLAYAVLLASMGLFVRAFGARLGSELHQLRSELPKLAQEARDSWIPKTTDKLREYGLVPQPLPPPADSETPPEPAPAIVAHPQPDGSLAVDVGSGVAVVPAHNGYVVEAVKPTRPQAFDLQKILADAMGKSFVYAQENTLEIARIGRDILAGVSRAIFIFFITLMLAAYLMMTREKIFAFFASLLRPAARPSLEKLLRRIDVGFAGVVRGQLIICLINGCLSAVGFAIVGLKYWPILAVVAAILSLIPIFGSIVSAVPAVAIGLTQGFGTALFVLAWILGIHQLEANLLNPKIMGDAAKIHPVLVVFSLLLGEHLFGAFGALLAVPTMSLAKSIFLHFKEIADASDPEMQSGAP
jgi:predicted PurR-regulated permease PerM